MRIATYLLAGLLGLLTAHYAGVGPAWPSWGGWTYQAIQAGTAGVCLARSLRGPDRGAWLAMAIALGSFFLGDVYYQLALSGRDEVPFPSPADAGYLGFYPATYVAIVLLVRGRLSSVPAGQWLDGVIGAVAVGAIGAALIFDPIVASTGGAATTVAVNLAYPLGDVLLAGLAIGAILLTRGWRDARWLLLTGGFALFAVVDTLYLYGTANGTYTENTVLDAGWPGAMVLLAFAATLRREPARIAAHESWRTLLFAGVGAVVPLGILLADHYHRVNGPALWLATAGLILVLVRAGVTFEQNLRMVRRSRSEAVTDPLTGLGNRRALLRDLERAVGGRPSVLALFDLDGFKAYNDTFGHPAGDALLARLGGRLAAAVPDGCAYRMGGDEFCVLVPLRDGGADDCVAAATAALDLKSSSVAVRASQGAVVVPEEASVATDALQLADQRMYEDKNSRRTDGSARIAAVLLRALHERRPDLGDHHAGVARLAEGVARRLGLPADELAQVRMAAALHDIGKLAISDSILDKPTELDDPERERIRRHTGIGARILAADPALRPVARMVRHSTERWDGAGYPDGLAGADIPLGARIISVCDAWDAMLAERPYRPALAPDRAVAELRACAGAQFDPGVVEAFIAEHATAARPTLRAA
jgi:two-component system, cell cycle response regulator